MVVPNPSSGENREHSLAPAPETSSSVAPEEPFEVLQIRSLLGTGFGGLLVLGFLIIFFAIPWSLLSLFGNPDSGVTLFLNTEYTLPLLGVYLWLYGVITFWCFDRIRRLKISLPRLFGPFPHQPREFKLLLAIVPVLMFSLGMGQLSLKALAIYFPQFLITLSTVNPLFDIGRTWISSPDNIWLILAVLIVAPTLEELFFRGLILQRLTLKWGVTAGIFLSSLMFGILHANVIGFFVFGIILALVYFQTRALWLPLFLHISNNAIALSASSLSWTSPLWGPSQNLEPLISSWRIGLVYASFSAPWLVLYIYHHWPQNKATIPYRSNRDRELI